MPARTRVLSRAESSVGDIRGTPRRRALKWRLPHSSSRITSIVHRSSSSSMAFATGQNCPYPAIAVSLRYEARRAQDATAKLRTCLVQIQYRLGPDPVLTTLVPVDTSSIHDYYYTHRALGPRGPEDQATPDLEQRRLR